MSGPEIAKRARFDRIRYAQVWEDADILVEALRPQPGDTIVSIGSAGDNCLALLAEGPARVIAVDLNPAQLACIRIRKAALVTLSHSAYLELMGSRPSSRRESLLAQCAAQLDDADQSFWAARARAVDRHGLGGVGKFEAYLRTFRRAILPIAHTRRDVAALLSPRCEAERARFYDTRWDTVRWRMLLGAFFSRSMMGRFGRDPSFFDYVDGDVVAHVQARCRHAGVALDPSDNPYIHWILTGRHGAALPRPLTQACFEGARERIDRLELRQGGVEALAEEGVQADAFNLSDIFEYMSPVAHADAYTQILRMARPGARLAYWNMMAPRRAPASAPVRARTDLETALKPRDKAFFYRDFIVEEVVQ